MFELMINGTVGLLCVGMGLLIWKKEKITLIHSYHYTKVREEDKKAYTSLLGKGLLIIGIGCILTGIINYWTNTDYGWFVFALSFIIGFWLMGKAQKKFNGGWF